MNPALADQISSFERVQSVNGDASANDPAGFLPIARSLIASLDQHPATPAQLGPARWLNLVDKLQMIAYYDPDRGGETDIALWCERQWATALQNEPDNITALQGIGRAWLLKSQPSLARINEEQTSSSSGSGSLNIYRQDGSHRHAAYVNSPDYMEARGTLRPSMEFFDRAIAVSNIQGQVSGELLALAAEAYISFGNVTHPQSNEPFYQTALRYLRRASQLEGYELVAHLQTFLDDNASFIQ